MAIVHTAVKCESDEDACLISFAPTKQYMISPGWFGNCSVVLFSDVASVA